MKATDHSWRSGALPLLLSLLLGGALLQGCASLPDVQRTPSAAHAASVDEELGHLALTQVDPGTGSAFRPLPTSAFSMDARLTLAAHAQRTLDVQYYLLQNDSTGRTLMRALRDAAVRGVRVRVLVDDLYTASSDDILSGLATYPNVEVRLFNPFPAGRAFAATRWGLTLMDFSRVNHRMHNKMFIADGAFAVAGGRNIADEYFFKSDQGNFVDFDLLVTGDAVPGLEDIFDRYWNSPRVYPLSAVQTPPDDAVAGRALFDAIANATPNPFPVLQADARDALGYAPLSVDIARPPLDMLKGRIHVFADDPEKITGRSEQGEDPGTVTSTVLGAIRGAHSDVLLASPYFVPGARGLRELAAARDKGVAISVVTNSMAANDEPLASAAYARYRKRMLTMGVGINEISSLRLRGDRDIGPELGHTTGRIHTKVIVIDHQTTFVGSMNLDLRSSRENTELGMLVDSPQLADDVTKLVERIRSIGSYQLRLDDATGEVEWIGAGPNGGEVFDSEPELDWATRFQVWLLSPFVSESLL